MDIVVAQNDITKTPRGMPGEADNAAASRPAYLREIVLAVGIFSLSYRLSFLISDCLFLAS
jgi:hypothetical protein